MYAVVILKHLPGLKGTSSSDGPTRIKLQLGEIPVDLRSGPASRSKRPPKAAPSDVDCGVLSCVRQRCLPRSNYRQCSSNGLPTKPAGTYNMRAGHFSSEGTGAVNYRRFTVDRAASLDKWRPPKSIKGASGMNGLI